MRATITLDRPFDSTGALRVRLLLRIDADGKTSSDRTPLNLSLVLDRSSSMAGGKLDAARRAAAVLVQRLGTDDLLSVIAYDDQVVTISEPETGAAQENLAARILQIRTGGCTNLSGGWLRGRELAARNAAPGTLSRILLLTDGLANAGITEPGQLIGLCAAARAEGIGTTTLGFGTDYDEHLLAAMADAGGGHTWYIETPDQAPAIFAEEIGGLLDVAAQNVEITIRPSPLATLAIVHHAYPRTALPDGARYDVGDLYARDPAVLLAEFLIGPRPAGEEAVPVAEMLVSADVVDDDGRIVRREIRIPVTCSPADGPRVDPQIEREVLLLGAARARREALERRDRGDIGGAHDVLRDAANHIAGMADADPDLAEEAADLSSMRERFAAGVADAADAKYLRQRAYDIARSRRKKSALIRRATGEASEP